MKKKIKRMRLLALLLFVLASTVATSEKFLAWDASSAAAKAASSRGWAWEHIGGGTYTWTWNKFCTLDSTQKFYFAAWTNYNTYPTCTTGGYAWFICKYSSDMNNSHGMEVYIGPLGHEFTSSYASATAGNNGAGDGYWWRKCSHCSTWGKTSTPITYYIKYMDTHITGNSTSGSMSNSTVTYDASVKLTNTYVKEGHVFKGWATTSQGEVVYTDGQQVKNLTVADGSTISLYAVWEPVEFTVSYDAGDGVIEGTTESSTERIVYYEEDVDLSIKAHKEGLVFIGWAYSESALVGLDAVTMPAWDIKLHAVYSLPVSDMKEALFVVWDKNKLENFRTYTLPLISIDPSGYSYSGLHMQAIDELGLVAEEDAEWGIVLYDNAGNRAVLREDTPIPNRYLQTVIHYVWDIEKQEYIYYTTTDELVYEGQIFTPSHLTEDDEDYPLGFYPSSIDAPYLVTKEKTTCAYYMPNEYKLYFDANEGVCDIEYKMVYVNYHYGELPIATRKGYDFVGWYTDPVEGTPVRNTDICTTASDMTVYAHWRIHSGHVVYDFWTNGGTDTAAYTKEFAYGTPVDLSVEATKPGWEFVGWNIYPDAKEGLESYAMPDEDLLLYAIFKKDVKAIFVDSDGVNTITREVASSIYGIKETASLKIPEQTQMPEWISLGWSIQTGCDADIMASSGTTIFIENDTTYYGMYYKDIGISYDTKAAAIEIPAVSKSAYYNASGEVCYPEFELAVAPPLEKHSFVKWVMLDEEGIEVSSHEQKEIVTFKNDVLLIATWDKYPEIEAYSRYFTLVQAQEGNITESKLLEKVVATDKEDGTLVNGESVVVLNYNPDAFKDMKNADCIEITYQAMDSFGNVVTKTVEVHVVDTAVKRSLTGLYVRFINKDYLTDESGEVLSNELGGLEETSIWKRDNNKFHLLQHTLSKETQKETWTFGYADILKMKEFTNLYGSALRAIEIFNQLFTYCRQIS